MALVVEDGTGVADANSFATRAVIIAYAAERGIVLTDDDATDVLAIKAMDYINAQPCWKGDAAFVDQPLPFPRRGLVEGDEAADYIYIVPANIVRAQCQLVVDISNGVDPMPSRGATPQVKSRQVGPIKREFFEQKNNDPWLPIVSGALNPFLCAGGSFRLRTYRV